MPTLCCNVAALAVASLFYYWRQYAGTLMEREGTLRERVAYLLWSMAGVVD
jgi:hypothetical protein